MHNARGLWMAAAMALAAAGAGRSGEPAALTLDAALDLAWRGHPAVREYTARIEAGDRRKAQAALWPRPMLDAAYLGNADDGSKIMVEFGQPIEIGGRRGARVREAGAGIAVMEAELRERWTQIEAGVRQAFAEAAWSADDARLARAGADAAAEALRLADSLRAAGRMSESELTVLRRAAAAAAAEAASARARAEDAPRQVHAALGRSPADPVVPVTGDVKSVRPPEGAYEELVRLVLTRHPALATARVKEMAAQARADLARADRWPNLRVGLKHETMDTGMSEEKFTGVGVGVDLPLWNRNQGEVAAAAREREAAGQATAAAESEALGELSRLLAEYASASAMAEEQRMRILPQAEAQRRLSRSRCEAGVLSRREDLQEESDWLQARRTAIEAAYREAVAAIQLHRVLQALER